MVFYINFPEPDTVYPLLWLSHIFGWKGIYILFRETVYVILIVFVHPLCFTSLI